MSRKQMFVIENKDKEFSPLLEKIFSKAYDICISNDGISDIKNISENAQCISAVFIMDGSISAENCIAFLQKLYALDLSRSFPIFLTAKDIHPEQSDFFENAYMNGIIDIIQMPFNPIVIEHRVKTIIALFDNRKQMEQLFNDQSELISKQLITLQKNQWAIIETLGNALESRDVESGDHVFRVKTITNRLARKLAINHPEYMLNSAKIELITFASTLHDIGKIAIPDSILRKPQGAGRLTDEEYAIMKTHTIEGCEVINSIPDFKDSALYPYCYDICRHHHERWDGKGYPDGLAGNDIPIGAQLVSIADVYDALVNSRIYKPAIAHENSKQMILDGKCGMFNPDLLECFEEIIDNIYEDYYVKNIHREN